MGCFVEEHGAVDRYGFARHFARDALEQGVLDPRKKERIALELLDLAVVRGGACEAFSSRQIFVAPGFGVVLVEEGIGADASEHDVVGSAGERFDPFAREHAPEMRKALRL